MARANFVKKARKDIEGTDIKAGESYYQWKFNFSKTKHTSKTPPKASQLTQSSFLSTLYGIQERIAEYVSGSVDDFISFKDEIAGEVESLKDDCQNSLDNMPEHLQESSSSGELLRERIDALENWQSEIESVECDFDNEDERSTLESEHEDEEDFDIDEALSEREDEVVSEALDNLRDLDCGL